MFDLQYYNKTLHKIEFENIIKEKGLIPIEDLSPIYGICYNENTIKKVDKLLKIDKDYANKIVFWKLLNDIDETKIKQKIKERNAYVKNENKELLQLLENFQNNFHNSRHPNFAYIQYNERIAYPFDITYNTRKIDFNKLIDNDIECSICFEIDNYRFTCCCCCTIICKLCHKDVKGICPICNNTISIDDFN